MKLEEMIVKIARESGLDDKEIEGRIKEKQKELGGLITPEGAAHLVANEVGINLFEGISKTHELKIENIIPGMGSVEVVGRIMRIFPTREFDKKDGSKGKVCSLILADETGSIRVIFWDKDVSMVEEGKLGIEDILRIKEAYTKESMNGEPEIHIGSKTRIIRNPGDINPEEVPIPEERKKRIAELEDGMTSVDVACRVIRIYEVREFEREDRTKGKVVNLRVADETGNARLVLWDDDVGLVEEAKIKEGDVIKVRRGYIKVRFDEPEINVGKYGKVVINPSDIEIGDIPLAKPEIGRKRIADLKEGDRAEVRGALVEVYDNLTIFDRKAGKGMVINAVIDDGSGSMRAAFYDKMAELLLNITLEKACEGDVSGEISERRKELLGREVIATVVVKHSDFSGRDELVVQDIDLNPDPREEASLLLREAKSLEE